MGQLRCGRDSSGAGERKKLERSSRVPIPLGWRAPAGQDSEHQVGVKAASFRAVESQTPLEPSPGLVSAQTGPSPVQTGSYSPKHLSMGMQGVLVWVGIRQPVRITEPDWMIHMDLGQSKPFCDVSMAPGLVSCHSINDRSGAGHSWAHPCPRMAPS